MWEVTRNTMSIITAVKYRDSDIAKSNVRRTNSQPRYPRALTAHSKFRARFCRLRQTRHLVSIFSLFEIHPGGIHIVPFFFFPS